MANKHEPLCLQAARHYARVLGWKLFPARLDHGKKYSWLSKANAPGGENWGMTNDPEQIEKNFNNSRWRDKCGVGLPTGALNDVFVIETDTKKGHAKLTKEGNTELRRMQKEHGKLPDTLMARSPSGSVHRFYRHPGGDIKIKSCDSVAGYIGVDVKGDGGMVVIPPSVRSDGKYKWINPSELPVTAPDWLIELTKDDKEEFDGGYDPDDPFQNLREPVSESDLHRMVHVIPNDDVDWGEWNKVAMSIFSSFPNDVGYSAFDRWSQKSSKYDAKTTRTKWRALFGSPPERITIGTLFALANEADPDWRDLRIIGNGAEPKIQVAESKVEADEPEPVDLWHHYHVPDLPKGLLPQQIEVYAFEQSELMGCDPAGLAMAALTVCAATIPDATQLQVKVHDPHWKESARLWIAMIGDVSAKKSPIIRETTRAIIRLDSQLAKRYFAERKAYDERERDDPMPEPVQERLKIEDATPESVQGILQNNPNGVLMIRDELSGWFGSMEKYGMRGGSSDRAFWLSAYNGGSYTFDRVKRGSGHIENLSINLLGGIQPSLIQRQADNIVDDGLIQRLVPVVLHSGTLLDDDDYPLSKAAYGYDALVEALYERRNEFFSDLQLDAGARKIRHDVAVESEEFMRLKWPNPLIIGHLGKYHGLFARLCVLWHFIEHPTGNFNTTISTSTAQRVRNFMFDYLLQHAITFYGDVLGRSEHYERILAIGGYILSKQLGEVTVRVVQRGTRMMRGLERAKIEVLLDHLAGYGWVTKMFGRRAGDYKWFVNPAVHRMFKERGEQHREQQDRYHDAIKTNTVSGREAC
jgi:Protein of unknown function (DUF3987)/Bifunctional DNA primase/polymerase, N-terminal/Primase C terminal 2 (PriCT-2)